MALNPAYASQTTRTLPFCVGFVKAIGEAVNTATAADGSIVNQYVLAEGEWDSPYMMGSSTLAGSFGTEQLPVAGGGYMFPGGNFQQEFHFHAGAYTPIGIPPSMVSIGPDQGTDAWLPLFPTVTPPLSLSGIACYFTRQPINTNPATPVFIWKTTKCRVFDNAGNVINYTFTTNPAWHMVEAMLRFQIKPQQPGVAGLTTAEKNCFIWPMIVDFAARNAQTLANGAPQFTSNYGFAADATLASIAETILRGCRGYSVERGGQIGFTGDDPRTSVFTFSRKNIAPGSIDINKKNLAAAANVYVPQYRELNIPAVSEVVSVSVGFGPSPQYAAPSAWQGTFTTVSQQPFASDDFFVYSGGTNDAALAGNWEVMDYDALVNKILVELAPPIANQFNAGSAVDYAASATGGYVGTQQSRFSQFAPSVVQHRSHQRSGGRVAPGIPILPRPLPVFYDLGNTTFDQSNRIMQAMMARDLGTDGPSWRAPYKGTLTTYLEAVDVNGNAVIEIEDGDRVTIDDTAWAEGASDFEVLGMTFHPPTLSADGTPSGALVDLTLQSYNPDAFPSTSYPPGDSYQTLPGQDLPYADTELGADVPYWVLRATPVCTIDGAGVVSVSVSDLSVMWMGNPSPVLYSPITIVGVPLGIVGVLFLTLTTPSAPINMTFQTPFVIPDGLILFGGSLSASSGSGSGGSSPIVHPLTVGGSSGTTLTLSGSSATIGGAATLVLPTRSAVSVVASPSTLATSGTAVFTAEVASFVGVGAQPTGTVQFYLNGTAVGSPVALVSGVAETSISFSSAGSNGVAAVYSGDANNQTSTGSTAFVVTP